VERDFPLEEERDNKTQKGNRGKQITIQYVWHALACGCVRIKDELEEWTRMLVRISYRMRPESGEGKAVKTDNRKRLVWLHS
jgi:hypothetical protein